MFPTLQSLVNFDPTYNSRGERALQKCTPNLFIKLQQKKFDSWTNQISHELEEALETNQIKEIRMLSKRILDEEKIPCMQKRLQEFGVMTTVADEALQGLQSKLLEIEGVWGFFFGQEALEESCECFEALNLTETRLSLSQPFSEGGLFFSGSYTEILEILLGAKTGTLFNIQQKITTDFEENPEDSLHALERAFKKFSCAHDAQTLKVTDFLWFLENTPPYWYSHVHLNDCYELQQQLGQHQRALAQAISLIQGIHLQVLHESWKALLEASKTLSGSLSEEEISKIVLRENELEDNSDLFEITASWPNMLYPKDYRRIGMFGDITDEEFSALTAKDAFQRGINNLKRIGLSTFADFKREKIYSTLMLEEYLSRSSIKKILNTLPPE